MEAASPAEAWEFVTIDDLRRSHSTELRRFLWRYGSDIRRGRELFRLLVDLYLSTRVPLLTDGELDDVLLRVSNAMPTSEEGRLLKKDLLSCGRSEESLLPAGDPVHTVSFFVRHPETGGLPAPGGDVLEALADLWPQRSDDILALAERAAQGRSQLAETLLERVAAVVDPAHFLELTRDRPNVRRRLLSANPMLLDSDHLLRIPQKELSELLAFVPEDEAIAAPLISRLLPLDDSKLAEDLLARFPQVAMRTLVDRLEMSEDRGEASVAAPWMRAVAHRSREFLHGGYVERARSTRVLAMLAKMLGHDRAEVLEKGPLPWARALNAAQDDVEGHDRQVFLAFLLAVGLAQPVPGCEPLFERAFESLHADLSRSTLAFEASVILTRHLPDLYWWQQWGKCLRLRSAVVEAYVEGGLAPGSFRRLTSDTWLFERLVDLAEETTRGRRFLKHLTA
jgi:hypothetical protein